uniref:Uncharacterized protein n=1 Tax=Arion vulgaris TaxID=1028688 RepID=A0A0B6Z031_9EUPU
MNMTITTALQDMLYADFDNLSYSLKNNKQNKQMDNTVSNMDETCILNSTNICLK